ncbi:MAG: nucleotide sugar dehydrogenase, partial [Myxococcota bacterium]
MEGLKAKIENRSAVVGVIGVGYVGLPLCMEMAKAGFRVIGFDVDGRKVASLNQGSSHIGDVTSEEVAEEVNAGRFRATTDFAELAGCDAVSICVPTPLNKTKDPDISYIVAATEQLEKRLHPGMLVILESTTYPGTTHDLVLPMLQRTGLKVGTDFYLAFSPERVDPGQGRWGIRNTPKVIGGVTPTCTEMSVALYGSFIERMVPVTSTQSAETVKLLENTFRAVNIALVNELKAILEPMKIDVWEVVRAAATKPFGYMPFFPGPGLGGHCIPIDPLYLSWVLKSLNYNARF